MKLRSGVGRLLQRMYYQLRRMSVPNSSLKHLVHSQVVEAAKKGPMHLIKLLVTLVGEDKARQLVSELVATERRLSALEYNLSSLDDAICAAYDEQMSKVHKLVRSGSKDILRYLSEEKGIAWLETYLADKC